MNRLANRPRLAPARNLRGCGLGSGLKAALTALDGRVATALVVATLDRLSRSLLDFAALMERGRRSGWALLALDLGGDTTTPSGEMMANVLAVFAQFERRLIGQRTREALAVKRSQGIRLGRPRTVPQETVVRIRRRRANGEPLASIAAALNREGRPTAHGGRRWYVSTVQAVLRSKAVLPMPVAHLGVIARSADSLCDVVDEAEEHVRPARRGRGRRH
jgi:hypothetical protein